MHLARRNPHAAQHLPAIAHPRARWLALRKAFENLDTDFLRDRTFDPAHAIPEPDYFPLLLDIHWSPPKIDQWEHNRNELASRIRSQSQIDHAYSLARTCFATPRFQLLEADAENFQSARLRCARLWLGSSDLLRTLRRALRRLGTLIVAGNHHGPIHAAGLRTFHAGNTDARRAGQQEIFSVP